MILDSWEMWNVWSESFELGLLITFPSCEIVASIDISYETSIPNSQNSRIQFQISDFKHGQRVAIGSGPGQLEGLTRVNRFPSEPRWRSGRLRTAAANRCRLSLHSVVYVPLEHFVCLRKTANIRTHVVAPLPKKCQKWSGEVLTSAHWNSCVNTKDAEEEER